MRVYFRALVPVVAVAAVLGLPAGAAADRSVYVTNSDTPATGLAAFAAAPDGTLATLAGTPVATGNEPTAVAVRPDARFAYVTNLNDDTIGIYELAKDGTPALQGTAPTAGNTSTGIAFTPDGNFMFVTNRDVTDADPSVSVFSVDADTGSLTAVTGSPIDLGIFDPRAPAVSPDGRFLYVTGRRGPIGPPPANADQAIAVAAIGANGSLTPIAGSPFYTPGFFNVFGATIAPDGSRLSVVDANKDKVEVFSLSAAGAPSPVGGSPFNAGDAPLVLSAAPDGERLYVGDATGEAVEGFNVNQATGALTPIAGTPLSVGGDVNGLALAADGEAVYASLLANPGQVAGLGIAEDGSLSALAGSPYPTGGVFPSFFGVAVTPTQTPHAAFSIDAKVAGKATKFDTANTSVRGGFATRFDWDFGDGTTLPDGGLTPKHVYADPGTYDVTLSVTNDCDPDAVFTEGVASVGNAVYCNGPREADRTKQVEVARDRADGTATARKKQKQEGRKIAVKVKIEAGEKLTMNAEGKIKAGGKSFALKKRTKDLKVGTKKLKLKPKRDGQKRKIAEALDRGEKVKAKLTVKLTDDAGNEKTTKLSVRLKSG